MINMALVYTGVEYVDTDDLDQPEYHYYRKAKDLDEGFIAYKILIGRLTADEIDTDPDYEWLRTPDGGL